MPRIFVDTEWTAPPWSPESDLLWIGLADDTGRAWFGISAEIHIDPVTHPFTADLYRHVPPAERIPLTRAELGQAIREFCGDEVAEFWAWIPPLERFTAWFKLAEAEGADIFARYWDTDLQMLQGLVQPWPAGWTTRLHNLEAAATAAGLAMADLPPRPDDVFHPRVHAQWDLAVYRAIQVRAGRA